jgi:hypothetical protein
MIVSEQCLEGAEFILGCRREQRLAIAEEADVNING